MTSSEHTPGPWDCDVDYIVAPDPLGRFPDIYIAEIADSDDEGRIAPREQQIANRQLIVASPALLAACRMVIARWERGDLAEAARACDAAVALATEDCSPPLDTDKRLADSRLWSVLLLYPDYANDSGTETFYAFVTAADPITAVADAQRQATVAQAGIDIGPEDFAPLLVTEGHHYSEPLFGK